MPNPLLRLSVVVLVAWLGVSVARAGPICPPVNAQDKSEGVWPIPEEAFTEQAAKRELKKLNRLLGAEGLTAESFTWESSFIIIEGWYLKRQALQAKKNGDGGLFVSDFCDFMKSRAYVRH
jgi:hypothetical protein